MSKNFEAGDLVWAKMKNYPPWPGEIADPPKNAKLKKGSHYVYFFGTNNFAWMKDETIQHHAEDLIPPSLKKKNAVLQSAINRIIELSQDRPFKVDSEVESTDDDIRNSANAKSLKDDMTKGGESIPISRKRLSSSESESEYDLAQVKRFDGGNSSKDPDWPQLKIISGGRVFYLSNDDDEKIDLAPRYVGKLTESNLGSNKSSDEIKYAPPTTKKIGILGLGNIGQRIAKNLLNSGHHVTIWNQTPGKCLDLMKAGAVGSKNPAEVVKASDIIFSCVTDANAVKSLVFGFDGVLKGLEDSVQIEGREKVYKGYVEMSSIDSETSVEMAEAIELKGGTYLEAPLIGSKIRAEEGNLFIIACGNKELFIDCQPCFNAVSSFAYYIGSDAGQSLKFSLIMSSFLGTTVAAMAETLALAERIKLPLEDFMNVLQIKGFTCPEIIDRAKAIIALKPVAMNNTLKHQQKDIDLTLEMGNQVTQAMPVTATANEIYKRAKLNKYGDHDIAAIYKARF